LWFGDGGLAGNNGGFAFLVCSGCVHCNEGLLFNCLTVVVTLIGWLWGLFCVLFSVEVFCVFMVLLVLIVVDGAIYCERCGQSVFNCALWCSLCEIWVRVLFGLGFWCLWCNCLCVKNCVFCC